MGEIDKDQKRFGGFEVFAMVVIFVILMLAWSQNIPGLEMKGKDNLDLSGLFQTLLLLSMILERSIEIFLSAMRSRGADDLDNRIDCLEGLSKLRPEEQAVLLPLCVKEKDVDVNKAQEYLMQIKTERINYRTVSRHKAIWGGLILGMLLSSFGGVRILEELYTTSTHNVYFTVLDIIITGSVLSGGSDFFNKLMKVYSSAMDNTSNKFKKAQ